MLVSLHMWIKLAVSILMVFVVFPNQIVTKLTSISELHGRKDMEMKKEEKTGIAKCSLRLDSNYFVNKQ